jgi:hypothetical protein
VWMPSPYVHYIIHAILCPLWSRNAKRYMDINIAHWRKAEAKEQLPWSLGLTIKEAQIDTSSLTSHDAGMIISLVSITTSDLLAGQPIQRGKGM